MDTAREPGRTFAPEDIGFFDFETRSEQDIKAGTYRYMAEADAIVLAFAMGYWPAKQISVPNFSSGPIKWMDMPADFRHHHDRVVAGEAVWCAWNAGFDRAAWNYATADFPFLEVHHVIDAMAQATNSGLPGSLKLAAKYSGSKQKVDAGADLIKLFCTPGSTATPQSHPEEWRLFSTVYAPGDVEAMQSVFQCTRQLPLAEWQEYWAMEKINERGVAIDYEMVKHATWLAHEDKRRTAAELVVLTEKMISSVDQVAQLTKWLLAKLPPKGREILLKREEEMDDDGTVTRPAKHSLTRKQVERLIAYAEAEGLDPIVQRVLQLRLYGGGKAPAKFPKMMAQHIDGVLYGQYVFSGAPQTGRASSKGVQVHNLTRKFLKHEHDTIEALLDRCTYEELAALGDDGPVAKKLALLIRPAFVPRETTNVFVWSDWSNIEARITPWLADYTAGGAERVQIFRDVDANPALPDLYTRTAAAISGLALHEVTEEIRQRGKVLELACLAADTRVLTDNGIKPIINVTSTDKLWDGRTWVTHQGLVSRGQRTTINLDGVEVTPDHLVETNGTWTPALQLASNASSLSQALATGSASLRSLAMNTAGPAASSTAGRNAHAEHRRTESCSGISDSATRNAVSNAQPSRTDTTARTISNTPTSSLMTRIAGACSTVLQRVLPAVQPRSAGASSTTTMGAAGFAFSPRGIRHPEAGSGSTKASANSSPIWSRLTAGIIPSWKWTESTLTEITNRGTSALRLRARAKNDLSGPCRSGSTNSKPVYDIAHAGPRNRFTIISDNGALVVHNCGFLGGVGALHAMAAGYGMHFTDEEARSIVERWRASNPWAMQFGEDLWAAMLLAKEAPGEFFPVGRVGYIFHPGLLGGSLLCLLPSGRLLTYRALRWEDVAEKDDDDVIIGYKKELTYGRGHGRAKLWKGILVENVTQATAADILRGTLVRCEEEGFNIRLHTHDEILGEVNEQNAQAYAAALRWQMQRGFEWTDGLPIMSAETTAPYYSKWKAK